MHVETIDGPGTVREVESRQGRTYYYVVGKQLEGWYASTEITSDIGDNVVTKPSDFPDVGTVLPYDPKPRDMFHDQLNIQPTADLPENLDPTNSVDGIRNYEPNAVFGSRYADGNPLAYDPDAAYERETERLTPGLQGGDPSLDPNIHPEPEFFHSEETSHPFGKVRNARHSVKHDVGFDDHDLETSDDELPNAVTHGTDAHPYSWTPDEWKKEAPGLDDYGDDYDKKNPQVVNSAYLADIDRPVDTSWNDKASEDKLDAPFAGNSDVGSNFDNPSSMDSNFEGSESVDSNFDDPWDTDKHFLDEPAGKTSSNYFTCLDCDGNGYVHGKRCETCQGSGVEKEGRVADSTVIETNDGFCVTSSTGAVIDGYFSTEQEAEFARWDHHLASNPLARKAAWSDVRKKALRLRKEGSVKVTYYEPQSIETEVRGDSGLYDTAVSRRNAFGNSVSYYSCTCPWGRYAFKREYKYIGRFCAHGYAAYMEMQSLDYKGAAEFNDARNPFVLTADVTELDDNSEQNMSGGDLTAPPIPPQGGQQLPFDPSHAVQPDGQMEVYSPQVEQVNNPVPQTNDDDAAGLLQNLYDTLNHGDQDIEGVEVPHEPDGDVALEGIVVDHNPMGDDNPMDYGGVDDPTLNDGNMPVAPISGVGDEDLANMAQQFLARTASKAYNLAEQDELVNERGQASQINALNLADSLYEEPNATFLAL